MLAPRCYGLAVVIFMLAASAQAQVVPLPTAYTWTYDPGDVAADPFGWRENIEGRTEAQVDEVLTTSRSSRAELRLRNANWLRVDESSSIVFSLPDPGRLDINVDRGVVYYAQYFGSGTDVDLKTPLATVHPLKNGRYEVSVLGDGEVRITVHRGKARISAGDASQALGPGRAMILRKVDDELRYLAMNAAPTDDWHAWNVDRDRFARKLPAYRQARRAAYRSSDYLLLCPQYPEDGR